MNADTRISLDRFASYGETVVARKIVRIALERGYTVSVYDGEEWTVKQSTDRMTILAAMCTTESDMLKFRKDGKVVGQMVLIWGNDPDELIADYSVDGGGEFDSFVSEFGDD